MFLRKLEHIPRLVGREPAGFAKLKQGASQQFRRIDLPGRSQILAEDEFDVPEVEMIIGIVTLGANRQKKLLRCFADAAYPLR